MPLKRTETLKQILLALAWLAVSARLLIPIGYMPAPISDGGLMFCPDGIVAAKPLDGPHRNGHDHGSHDENPAEEHGSEIDWNQCPYGALAKSAPVTFELAYSIESLRPAALPVPATRLRIHAPTGAFRARAPPAPSA
jgi:hypothetical protein